MFPASKILMTAETRALEMELLAAGADAVLVPARAAGESGLADLLGLLEGTDVPSRRAADEHAAEVLA